jgi:hypothetical protein
VNSALQAPAAVDPARAAAVVAGAAAAGGASASSSASSAVEAQRPTPAA